MKVSLSWLKDYVSIEMEIQNLADALTMAGLEVEAVSDRYDYLDSVVVGCVVKISPHPNADKLQVCEVDVGERIISVVCGAPNITKDMLSPTALPGTVLPDGFILEKTIMRGVTSEGMLCSEGELGLGPDKSGIMAIKPSKSVGDKVAKALELSDMVVELDLTPNRPDCLSIIGIAREIAAIQKTNIRYPDISLSESSDNISDLTSVTIEAPDHCPRYAARLLFDVSIEPSPFWLQDRLMSVGLKPINNIVDITNFVLMETGQPLHAFDFDNLAENRIVVRTANEGETFTSLDNKDRILSKDMLMICDGEKPVAIGGVMGGFNSEIEVSTTRVLIESAYFDP
ncbi:MAG: phenylalanine--tRNA ligase subunit beta, partial [Desulfobacteraceae bacterium]